MALRTLVAIGRVTTGEITIAFEAKLGRKATPKGLLAPIFEIMGNAFNTAHYRSKS